MPVIKNKRILITGGAGFIGSHLVDGLLSAGAGHIVVVDNFFLGRDENLAQARNHIVIYRDDASDYDVMNAIINNEKIEIIYNLATIALNYSFFNPYKAYMVNVNLADTMLRLLKQEAYKTLIHISSSEAYGTVEYSPMDEKHPLVPTTPYAAGKASADLLIQSFYNLQPMDISIIRPFNNYGPRQNFIGQLAAVIPITAQRIKKGNNPIIEGDGKQTRDFIYVNDTVRALILAYENEETRREIINVGSGIEITIEEVIKEICAYYKYIGEIDYQPARPADVRRLCACNKKAEKLLKFKPQITYKSGLYDTLQWYDRNM